MQLLTGLLYFDRFGNDNLLSKNSVSSLDLFEFLKNSFGILNS